MIRIYLGKLGSSKTCSTVRELIHDQSGRTTYTNINVKKVKNVKKIKDIKDKLKSFAGLKY